MNSKTIIYCLFAVILGMLLFYVLNNVCGCKVIEGQTDIQIHRIKRNILKLQRKNINLNNEIDKLNNQINTLTDINRINTKRSNIKDNKIKILNNKIAIGRLRSRLNSISDNGLGVENTESKCPPAPSVVCGNKEIEGQAVTNANKTFEVIDMGVDTQGKLGFSYPKTPNDPCPTSTEGVKVLLVLPKYLLFGDVNNIGESIPVFGKVLSIGLN